MSGEAALEPHELLGRMATTVRQAIAPEVGDAFAKTQAFMAAVILDKVSRQLRLAAAHAEAERADRAALAADLEGMVDPSTPPAVRTAVARVAGSDGDAALGELVAALYAEQASLGPGPFDALLGRVRATLRSRLDRQLEYST